jgi:glyoxylase-like metal-dependent hydrolase (beta-lactamase superfamily II)
MQNELFRFAIGRFTCLAIRDGDDWHRNVLLINTGQHNVLIDTGNGSVTSPPGLLLQRLRSAGISPSDITLVILSHADTDHIAGTADASGNITFPYARHLLAREEWAFWTSPALRFPPPSDRGLAAVLGEEFAQLSEHVPRTHLSLLRDKLELLPSETEVVSGIQTIAAPGHTPGHTVIRVSSAGESLLFIGDLAYQPNDIGNPDWHAIVDVDPAQASVTRELLFEQAAREGMLLMGYHFPFPGLGYVGEQASGWRWRQLEMLK